MERGQSGILRATPYARLKREAARRGTRLDPKDESGLPRSGRPTFRAHLPAPSLWGWRDGVARANARRDKLQRVIRACDHTTRARRIPGIARDAPVRLCEDPPHTDCGDIYATNCATRSPPPLPKLADGGGVQMLIDVIDQHGVFSRLLHFQDNGGALLASHGGGIWPP